QNIFLFLLHGLIEHIIIWKIFHDFKLLYRSNRDGTDTNTFHKNCDNKGATIWV
ncbi:hypothetical protein GLOIN_2v1661376, partial [Rhizophagus irregularis DAOM 181602=DAOM 197198]